MKPMYKKLLKELEEGNAVLLEVGGRTRSSRYRIVTPNNCEYALLDGNCHDGLWRGCVDAAAVSLRVPKVIVDEMYMFDQEFGLKITKMQVLK